MDLCPVCQTLLMVKGGKYSTENDDNPDTPTGIYYTQEKYCNNPSCSKYNKAVDVIKHKVN